MGYGHDPEHVAHACAVIGQIGESYEAACAAIRPNLAWFLAVGPSGALVTFCQRLR